jgi:hypothetical protein
VDISSTAERGHTEDELIQKLEKLKILFEKQLISQAEYERKKADILSQL